MAMRAPLVTVHEDDLPIPSSQQAMQPTITMAGGGASVEESSGLLQRLTFRWMSDLIAEGYRRHVQYSQSDVQANDANSSPQGTFALMESDLPELRHNDLPETIRFRIETEWQKETQTQAPDLRRALRRAFGSTFYAGACFKFSYDTLQMAGPFLLKHLLGFLNRCEDTTSQCEVGEGLLYVALMLLNALTQTTLLQQYFHRTFRTGMRVNCASISLIYAKALRCGGSSRPKDSTESSAAGDSNQRTSGEIVNLMAIDSQRLQDLMTYLHTIWSGPYQIVITLIFLSTVMGWASCAGVAVIMLQIPLMNWISRKVKLAQRALMKIKDERIKVTNEVFSSVRLLKMYGWEDSFRERLNEIRERELRQLRKYQVLNVVSSAVGQTAPILTAAASFAMYTAIYGELNAATAFTALSLFNILRFPMAMFPNVVSSCVEAGIAVGRIQSFLLSPEVQGQPRQSSIDSDSSQGDAGLAVKMSQAKLVWPDGGPLLGGVNLSVPAPIAKQKRAHLTVVVGAVGAGKSGLLKALIGDLGPTEGTVTTLDAVAYASQVAWVRNATVMDNIVFHSIMDKERYAAVLEACCLLPDLDSLPCHDQTEIGEKGVNLSGGQKQRISLARAVYSSSKLLLLDDVLSAVDAEVAKKLLKMLRGPLVANSSIVLCTHYLSAIKHADQVVLIERSNSNGDNNSQSPEGHIAFCGPPQDFLEQHPEMVAMEEGSLASLRQTSVDSGPLEDVALGPASTSKPSLSSSSAGRLVQRETERVGSVPMSIYKTYIMAAGGGKLVITVLLGVAIGQGLQTAADYWVSFWSDHSRHLGDDETYISSSVGLLGYLGFSFAAFFGVIATSTFFRLTALNAARFFHQGLLQRLLCLPMVFYDTTPLGRVLNRLSKDIYTIDEQLQMTIYASLTTLARVFATLLVITVATPLFLVVITPLLWMYVMIQRYFIPSSRQLKRIESNLRSPIFSHFAETVDGASSIRAFAQQSQFVGENADRLRRTMRAYYLNVSSNRWLAVRLESLGTGIVSAAGLLAVLKSSSLSAGMAGLSISYALSVTQSLNWAVRMSSDRETNIVAVERVHEYMQEDPEPPHHVPDEPSAGSWPKEGSISFQNVSMRYRQDLPLVLDNVSLEIRAQEKLGICGRTGAGKSSVLNVLLRMVDPLAGKVCIDGLDISTIGLHRLRHSLTVIPQDPVLFSGTLRFNLDPLEFVTSNDKLWQALRRSHLASHVETLAAPDGAYVSLESARTGHDRQALEASCLQAIVAEKGSNFSHGQRQQLCLARALLRDQNRILLLDEATSAVDKDTDHLIQQTIRTEFASHTVLCIAHRISTIMDSDRVCVLDGGHIAELGNPKELCKNKEGKFAKLAEKDAAAW